MFERTRLETRYHRNFFAAGTLLVGCLLISDPSLAQAIKSQSKAAPSFELSAGAIGVTDLPSLFWLEEDSGTNSGKPSKRWVRLEVPEGSRGMPVKLPLKPSVQLFTGDPSKPDTSGMEPFLQIPAKKDGDRLFLLFHLDENGSRKHHFLEDPDGSHPAGSVRVINLTNQRMAVSAGGGSFPVLAGGQQMIKPVLRDDGRFAFKHFEERAGGSFSDSPVKLLRFPRKDMRLLVVFAPMPNSSDPESSGTSAQTASYSPAAVRLYDREPGLAQDVPSDPQMGVPPVLPPPKEAANGNQTTAAGSRDFQIGVLALGEKWRGENLELGLPEQSGSARVDLQPGILVPVKIPVLGESHISLRVGGVPLGDVTLGASALSALLALAPQANMQDPASFGLYETSDQSHPRGRMRIFNLTPFQLAYTSGTKPTYVNPQGSTLVEGTEPGRDLALKLAVQVDGVWKLIDQSPRKCPPKESRAGLFVYPSPREPGSFQIMEVTL